MKFANIARRLFYPFVFAFSALLIAATVQAQEVYNFYFQKAPSTAPVLQNMSVTPPVLLPSAGTDAGAKPAESTIVAAPITESLSTAKPEAKSDPEFRRWSAQIMLANVSDTNSDVSGYVKSRLGLQFGYRFNKYVGLESGMSIGSLKGRWQDETGTNGLSSIVPFAGIRLNAIHLNIFGAEIFEFFFNGGAMYIDQNGESRGRPSDSRTNNAEIYGYIGGGMRTNYGERVGVEIAGRVIAGDPAARYGMATAGVDIRF